MILTVLAGCGGQGPDIRSEDPYLRYLGLVDRLEASETEEAVRLIRAGLKDAHYLVREGAVRAIGTMRLAGLLPEALGSLKDEHPRVRKAACTALGAFRDQATADVLAGVLTSDPSPGVRAEAARVLGKLPSSDAVFASLVSALEDPDPAVRLEAHATLVRLSGRDFGPREKDRWKKWFRSRSE